MVAGTVQLSAVSEGEASYSMQKSTDGRLTLSLMGHTLLSFILTQHIGSTARAILHKQLNK